MIRFVFATLRELRPDFSGFSILSGWESVEKFAKRTASLAAFVAVSSIMLAPFIPTQAQNGEIGYRIKSAEDHIAKLEELPARMARLEEKLANTDAKLDHMTEQLDWLVKTTIGGAFTVLMFLLTKIMGAFGVTVRKKTNEY